MLQPLLFTLLLCIDQTTIKKGIKQKNETAIKF